eukprot:6204445-Pleurochrysis_carterae.AAC.2
MDSRLRYSFLRSRSVARGKRPPERCNFCTQVAHLTKLYLGNGMHARRKHARQPCLHQPYIIACENVHMRFARFALSYVYCCCLTCVHALALAHVCAKVCAWAHPSVSV